MIFKSVDGSELSLEILGYEFPENDHDMYDSNWLMIRMIAKSPLQVIIWQTVEQYMDTYGAYYLYLWFSEIADGHLVPLLISTGWVDELYFEVTQITDHVSLNVKSRYYRVVDGHKVVIRSTFNYDICLQDFKAATAQWSQEIQEFPTRVHRY